MERFRSERTKNGRIVAPKIVPSELFWIKDALDAMEPVPFALDPTEFFTDAGTPKEMDWKPIPVRFDLIFQDL